MTMNPREAAEAKAAAEKATAKRKPLRDAATPELFAEYQRTQDPGVREALILAHMNLVRYLARKFANRGEPLEDLTQVGMIGLINAIDRFDPSRGIRFATYATPTIVGEIRRYFRDRGWAVKVPRRLQELNLAASKAVDDLTQKLDRVPTVKEVADALGVGEQEALEARAAAEDAVAKLTTRARLEVAGEFGEKRFLVKLEELVKGRPYDIVNIQLHVPTVQGAMEKAPSFMLFEVTSTEQEDIQGFLPELRSLIRDNGLVLVNETNVS